MNCERIQELILTDYNDGQLIASWKKEVDQHVHTCAACASLLKRVQSELNEPLSQLKRLTPDESIWKSIKANIEPSVEPAVVQLSFLERLWEFLYAYRPAIITACVFLIIGAVVLNSRLSVKHQPYVAYLMSDDSASNSQDTASSIERYFL